MIMFLTIIRRDAKEGLMSPAFLSTLALLTVLAPLSAYTQARYNENAIDDYTRRQEIHEEIHRDQESTLSLTLARPRPPLAPFFNGVFDSLSDEAKLLRASFNKTDFSEDLRPLDSLFPRIDLSLIVGLLMTLIAILLSHDAITGEKEQGTLKLMLAGPVPRRSLLAAKLTGVVLLMAISLAYTILLYTLVVVISSDGKFDISLHTLMGLVIYALVSLLLLILFAALGIAASTMAKQSSASLYICMGVWVILVLIWPSLAPYVVSYVQPNEPKQMTQGYLLDKEKKLVEMEMAEHKQASAELAAQRADAATSWRRYSEIRRHWTERKREEIADILADRERKEQTQQEFARRILIVSPYGAFNEILGALCETRLQDHHAFLNAAERYDKEEFVPASLNALAQEKPWLKTSASSAGIELPPFQVPAQSLGQRVKSVSIPIGLLTLEIALVIAMSLLLFSRYDVR
jgi:ABC-type transport system involved in multi-copper enzyme maturation permease subunit